jgi:hypothetical protein
MAPTASPRRDRDRHINGLFFSQIATDMVARSVTEIPDSRGLLVILKTMTA